MKLESAPGTYTYNQEHGIVIEKEKQEFLDDLKAGVKITTAHGIFGPEDENSDAYVRIIRLPEGGTYLKVYGCRFTHKGNSPRILVYGLQMPKFLLSDFSRRIIGGSILYSLAVAVRFLFQRKKFIEEVYFIFKEINDRIRYFYDIPEIQNKADEDPQLLPIQKTRTGNYVDIRINEKIYNDFEKELARAGRIAIKGAWEKAGEQIIQYACLFLFLDNTYNFRVKDALGEGRDVWGTLDTLISREATLAQSPKWKFIKRGAKIMLFISPSLKRVVYKFFDELDRDKVRLDEADWYWCLKTTSYNYGGRDKEWRYAERERLDKLNHTVFLI